MNRNNNKSRPLKQRKSVTFSDKLTIPNFQTTNVIRKTSAWNVNANLGSVAAPFSFTNDDILSALLATATAATTAVQAGIAFKIKKISLYGPPPGPASLGGFSLEYPSIASEISGPNLRTISSTMGNDQIARVVKKPPKGSSQAFWQTSNANAFFQVVCSAGSLIMIDYILHINDSTSLVAVTQALVGATAGAQYQLALDGNPVATTKVPAYGYITA